MNLYPLNINSHDDMKKICARIKTDPRALAYLIPKRKILHFYADNIDYRAAAFMKQEMLSRGGDTVVTKHVIDGKTDTSDILIMGTPSQIKSMIHKMNAMPIWGLDELRRKLSDAFTNMNINEWIMTSPNGHEINLSDDTKIMAIMNLTPDSFYEPSRINENNILSRAEKFLSEGAYVLDIGAESTRPGAVPVDGSEELSRLIPALKILRSEFPDALISVDTYKPNVARIAVNEGAD
ncbi:MAG: dihydropteroate synthase, partial [Synergistaceae bacterium]|nr:dihydropteroate synthase [Synergistaceae bacterium]